MKRKNPCAKEVQSEKGCAVPSPLTCPSTKKSDGTKEFATTDSMDGCNVLPETQFVVNTTRVLSVVDSLPPTTATTATTTAATTAVFVELPQTPQDNLRSARAVRGTLTS